MSGEIWRRVKRSKIIGNLWCKRGTRIFPHLGNVSSKFLPINAANWWDSVNFAFLKDMLTGLKTKTIKKAIEKLTSMIISEVKRVNFTVLFHY